MTLCKTMLALALGALALASTIDAASAYSFFGGYSILGYVGW